MALERVQRSLARAGYGSRRASEDLIREGRVTINGLVASLGDRVDPQTDVVHFHNVSLVGGPGVLGAGEPRFGDPHHARVCGA